MSVRTGNFFVNENLDIRTLQLPIDQYRHLRRKSILIALTWLETHVLNRRDVGHHLRERIEGGVKFNDETHKYLINSCLHWKSTLSSKIHKRGENSSLHRKDPPRSLRIPNSPGGFESEKPLSCPGLAKETRSSKVSPKIYISKRHVSPLLINLDRAKPQLRTSDPNSVRMDRASLPIHPVRMDRASILPDHEKQVNLKYREKPSRKNHSHQKSRKNEKSRKKEKLDQSFRSRPIEKPKVAPIQPLKIPNTGIYRKKSRSSRRRCEKHY